MPSSSAQMLAIAAREPPMSGWPVVTTTLPSSVMLTCALDSPPALNQKPQATPRPWLACRAAPCSDGCSSRPRSVSIVADAREDRAVRGLGALLGGVLQAEVERIHLQRFGEFVEHAFDGVGADRRARRAIGRDLGAVGDDVVAHRRARSGCRRARSAARGAADRRAREGAGLQIEGALRGDDLAVLRGADLDRALRARGRAGRAEHFLARHHHLHRAAGLLRQHESPAARDRRWSCRRSRRRSRRGWRGCRSAAMPVSIDVIARTMNWPWLELQIVVLPSGATLTRQACGSI